MDQHPIPQDVTGFQFKLIGTMTVKQFGYVASGVVLAVIMYYFPFNSAFGILLKVFLVPLFGASGVIVAFVPLDGRPIDVMTTNFAKALFSPNQYVYHRQGQKLSFATITLVKAQPVKATQQKTQAHPSVTSHHDDEKEEKLRALLLSSHEQTSNAMDKKEAAFLEALTSPNDASKISEPQPIEPALQPIQNTPQQPAPALQPSPQPVIPPEPTMNSEDALNKKESELTRELNLAKLEETTSKTPALHDAAEQKVAMLSKQIDAIHAQKQKLEQELSLLRNQLASQKAAPVAPIAPKQDPQHVRAIPQGVTKNVGLPHVSDSPNVVVGIVKDPRGNILPNILVEVKDKDNNPVRAFKTNQLGQFASATPLSPGTYNIELDDPKKQQRFDVVQITANNTVLPPIEIISHDAREELRKQLFAN